MNATKMKFTLPISMLVPLLLIAGCGNGAARSPGRAGSEFEELRGPDLSRARRLYAEGKREEGAAVLRSLAADSDWSVRSQAIRAIGEVRDADLLPVVHEALRDERLEVRESAGRVLVSLGNASSRAPLRNALSDPDGIVRSHSAEALLRIGGIEELGRIAELLENDTDPTARATIARALGSMRDPAVVPVLIGALDDENPMVRGEAAEAIGATGLAAGRAALENAATNDPDPGVRQRAAAALQRLDGADGDSDRR